MNKRCSKCHKTKSVSGFSKNQCTKDGLQRWCRVCAAAYRATHKVEIAARSAAYYVTHKEEIAARSAAYYAAHKEEEAAYRAVYIQTPNGKAVKNAAAKRMRAKYPQRQWCRSQFSNAIRDGKIKRQPCVNGCKAKAEGHHTDYSKPFDVIWLCASCHRAWHKNFANKFYFNFINSLREILRKSKAA